MAFPTVSLYDTFNRANESPISNGGRWASITGLTSTTTAGTLVTKRYAPESFTAGKETAAYWTPIEFGVIPAVAFETKEAEANAERYDSLFICLSNPTVAEKCSGYRLKWITTGVAKKVEIKVDVIENNIVTQLALTKEVLSEAGDLYGLSVNAGAGTVSAWHKTGAGAWTEVNSTPNTKYTKGFVGIGGAGSNVANQPSKFEIGGTKFAEAKPIEFVKNTITAANAATAGGELEFTGEAGQVGNRWIMSLAKASEAEAESITDSLGSTWVKDAHETNTGLRCELWSAEIISNAIPTIKVKGLGALTKVALTVAEFSGIQTGGSYVSATAGGKGTGTAVNAGTLEPAESRLAFAGFAVLSEATLTPENGFTAITSAKSTAISAEGMWLLKPSGSVTAKGSLSLTGVWAGEYALYKAQTLTQSVKGSLNPTATKPLLGSLPSEENETAGIGESEVYAYKAKATGIIKGITVQTNSVANTGMTSLTLGIYEDVAGKPGAILGEATFSGEPKTNSKIRVEGLSIPVTSGTQYWFGFVNLGGQFHFNKGGTKAENQYWFRNGLTEAKLPAFTGEPTWKTESQAQGAFEGYGVTLSTKFSIFKTLTASLKPEGALTKNFLSFSHVLTAKLKPEATLTKNLSGFSRTLNATLKPAGAIKRSFSIQHILQGALKPEGILDLKFTGLIKKVLTASLKPEAILTKNLPGFSRTFTAKLKPEGTFTKAFTISKVLKAQLTPAAALQRNILHQLQAAFTPTAVLHRTFEFKHFIQANLSPSGSLNRNTIVALKASLQPIGSLGKGIAVRLTALLSPTGKLEEVVTQQNNTPVTKDQPGVEGRNPRYRIPPIRIRVR